MKSPSNVLALLLLAAFAGWNLWSWPARLAYPGDASYGGEAIPMADLLHLRQGVAIYSAPTAEQYDGANWGPLYYLAGSRLVDPAQPSYLPVRLLAALGLLGCAALIGLLAYWIGGNKQGAVLACLLFLGHGFVTWNGLSVRGDSISLLFMLAGFCVAYRGQQGRRLLLSIPLFLLGLLFKPLFLAAPAAVFLFLVRAKRYRPAAQFAGLMAAGGALSLAHFQWVHFAGQDFFGHFLLYNSLPFHWLVFLNGIFLFVMALLVVFLAGDEYLRRRPDPLLHSYFALSVFGALFLYARTGSNSYYFMESAAILSVPAALLLAQPAPSLLKRASLLGCLAASLWAGLQFRTPAAPVAQDAAADQAVQNYLRERFPSQTLALGYYSGDLNRAGLETPITNLFHYVQLVRKGIIDAEGLPQQLRDHRFAVLVFPHAIQVAGPLPDFFYLTEQSRQAILENYRLQTAFDSPAVQSAGPNGKFYIWVPRESGIDTPGAGE